MSTITTRAGKGSALSYAEMDANFTNLNTDKVDASALAPYETSAHAAATYATQVALAATDAEVATKQDALPTQTGNNGKYLQTNGTTPVWSTVDALPTQTGNAGKVLTTDGSIASWASQSGNTTSFGLFENSATIGADYTIATGNNAISAGPITISSGFTVTVPSGSTWSVV